MAANESFTLNGSGTITFDGNPNNHLSLDNGAVLTLGSGWIVNGKNGTIGGAAFLGPTGSLINNGVIREDVLGGAFTINGLTTTNNGTIQPLNNGALTISNSTITKNGSLQALNNSNLILASQVSGSGSITADGSSTITQNSVISGQAIAGFLNYSGGSTQLNNDTFAAGSVLLGISSLERVTGGLTLKAPSTSISMAAAPSSLAWRPTKPTRSMAAAPSPSTAIPTTVSPWTTAPVLTLGSGWIVNGKTGTIGGATFIGPTGTLTNNGVIRDDVLGGTFVINSTATTNNGTLQALNNGTLILASSISGSGTITADGSSTIAQNGVSISGQTIAGFLNYSAGFNLLNNDTVAAGSVLLGIGAQERVTGGLSLNGVVDIFGGSIFGFGVAANETFTLNGSGTFTFDGSTNNQLSLDNGAVLTLGSGYTIHGKNGTIGGVVFAGPSGALINNGTIALDNGVNGLFTISASTFTNNGTISVNSNDTVNVTAPTFTNFNSGTSNLTGGSYNVSGTFEFLGANIVINAASITLSGPNSAILSNTNGLDALAGFFTSNIGGGSFTLQNGRSFTSPPGGFGNAGSLTVDATGGSDTFQATGAYTQSGGVTTLIGGSSAGFHYQHRHHLGRHAARSRDHYRQRHGSRHHRSRHEQPDRGRGCPVHPRQLHPDQRQSLEYRHQQRRQLRPAHQQRHHQPQWRA